MVERSTEPRNYRTKQSDRVNYWKLFNQLLDDGIRVCYVELLVFWYTEQVAHMLAGRTPAQSASLLAMELDKVVFCHHTCYSRDMCATCLRLLTQVV